MRTEFIFLLGLLFVAQVSCLGPIEGLYPPKEGEPVKRIYLADTGWHVALIFETPDVQDCSWARALLKRSGRTASDYKSVEIGWGDRCFYLERNYWPHALFYAVFLPSPSVVHLSAFSSAPEDTYPVETLRVDLSEEGFRRLLSQIEDTFEKDGTGEPIFLQEGYWGRSSAFFDARYFYGFWRTCNKWTAENLRAAGCPITPAYALFASNLLYQARSFAAWKKER